MLLVSDVARATLDALLERYGLQLKLQDSGTEITGSFWGDSEAGIVGRQVFVRPDTPVHSFLHETCHVICMTAERRNGLHKDAGGDDLEEAAVCYLQVILADSIAGTSRTQLMQDMDDWGYSFRLGNTARWFQSDASDAEEFLKFHGLLSERGAPTFKLRS
ncbi:MAG: hypothetical protein K0U72_07840 [Gammaproteobacteria bacterium]|nr:hypothetical protein [Gammaproteobacteria bacterium]